MLHHPSLYNKYCFNTHLPKNDQVLYLHIISQFHYFLQRQKTIKAKLGVYFRVRRVSYFQNCTFVQLISYPLCSLQSRQSSLSLTVTYNFSGILSFHTFHLPVSMLSYRPKQIFVLNYFGLYLNFLIAKNVKACTYFT